MFLGAAFAFRESVIVKAADSPAKNDRWRIVTATLVLVLYLVAGLLAQRWWIGLGTEASIWGVDPNAIANRNNYSLEPIATALIPSLPSVLICICSRSKVIHLFLIGLAASQAYYGIYYLSHGSYFGCDRNGCSAEENFALGNVILAVEAIVGAFAIKAALIGFAMLTNFARHLRKSSV
jgi:hypothetical protein